MCLKIYRLSSFNLQGFFFLFCWLHKIIMVYVITDLDFNFVEILDITTWIWKCRICLKFIFKLSIQGALQYLNSASIYWLFRCAYLFIHIFIFTNSFNGHCIGFNFTCFPYPKIQRLSNLGVKNRDLNEY